MHNGGVETGLGTLVQEDAVEYLPSRGVEAEGDVGQTQNGAHARQFGLDAANRLDGLDAVAARIDHARGQRQGEGIDEDVGRGQTVARHGQVGDGGGRTNLPVRGARLAFFVDARRDDGGAELRGEREESVEASARPVALFEVDRVENGLAAEPGERFACDLGLGGVDHDRHRGLRRQAAHHLAHVGDAVRARVVHAHVEDVGTLLDLIATNGDAGVPVTGQHRLAELLGSIGVGALADQQHRTVLFVGDG